MVTLSTLILQRLEEETVTVKDEHDWVLIYRFSYSHFVNYGSGAMSGTWTLLFKYSISVLINIKEMFWSNGKVWFLYSLFGNA